jgi:phosphoglycerate kinase
MFEDKRVLVRVEYNVPLNKEGDITDNFRIKGSIPTLQKILSENPKQLVLMFHLGRPKNKETIFKTDKVAKELSKLLGEDVVKVDHCGEGIMPSSRIVMLENLRFYEGEQAGDMTFAKQLAKLGDVYVNESFGTCHREDASMYAVPSLFSQNNRIGGYLLKNEVERLTEVANAKSLTTIVGFAKITDKLKIMEKLLQKCDKMLVGGAVAFSFLKAQGYEVGKSLCVDPEVAGKLYNDNPGKIILPLDFVGKEGEKIVSYDLGKMSPEFAGLDIGPKTVAKFEKELETSKLVFWNGPTGMFEVVPFDKSTNDLSAYLAKHKDKVRLVVGGGDTALAIAKSGFADQFYHISSGGGASLELIENGTLPALKYIEHYME